MLKKITSVILATMIITMSTIVMADSTDIATPSAPSKIAVENPTVIPAEQQLPAATSSNLVQMTEESSSGDYKDRTIVDLASAKSFRVTAGSGPEQDYDYSKLKQTYFTFAQSQKLQVDVDYILAFHTNTSGNSIKLIFTDSQQHTVEVIIKEGEKGEVAFENSGVYSLSIQNDGTNSLAYSFILN